MASTNIYTVLALCFVFVACEASAIKGLGTAGQIGIPGIPSIQASEPPKEVSNPSFPQTTSTNPAASGTGVSVHSVENEPGPTDSLPSKPEGSGLLTATSPKEEMPGVTAFPVLARIPGYDERCNMQAATAKTKCKSKPGGKKRHRRWYLDPSSKKCLPSCEKKAPFRYKIHCDAICRTEKVCHLAPTGFPCVARTLHPVFIYNRNRKKCVRAEDCDYYGNKFVTLRECQNTCEKGGLQQTPQLVTSTTATSSASSNRITAFLPPRNGVLTPSFPGASNGQVITGNIAATGGLEQQSSSGSATSSQVSTQAPNLVSSMRQPQTELPGLHGLPDIRVLGDKPSSSGAASVSQITGQASSAGPPVLGITASPGLEIVREATSPNEASAGSKPSDTSEEALTLDLGLGAHRGPSNTGATSVSRTLSRSRFGLPASLGPASSQFGTVVSPELEIVAVGTRTMPGPPSGPRRNQGRTGTSHSGIPGTPVNSGLGRAPSRVSSISGKPESQPSSATSMSLPGQRLPSLSNGTPAGPGLETPGLGTLPGSTSSSVANTEESDSTTSRGTHHPSLGVLRGQQPGATPNQGTAGVSLTEMSGGPANLDLGLTRREVPSRTAQLTTSSSTSSTHSSVSRHTQAIHQVSTGTGELAQKTAGFTGSSKTNIQASGITKGLLTVPPVSAGKGLPPVPPVKVQPLTTKTSGISPQAPSRATFLTKQQQTVSGGALATGQQTVGTSKVESESNLKGGVQAPSRPSKATTPVHQKPSLPRAPSLNQNVIIKRPWKQTIESQILSGSQVVKKGPLNDQALIKKIQKKGNEKIDVPVLESEIPVISGPLNEPPLATFTKKMYPAIPGLPKLSGLLKVKTAKN
uniref:Pancreatic trypsin inhibitor n=1 Tax=Rhipicephalus zambeziensis TaxID=60191 RepID=A0A224Y208_9ACAR